MSQYELQIALNWLPTTPPPADAKFTVAGVPLTPAVGSSAGTPAQLNGSTGLNSYQLVISGTNLNYESYYLISLVDDGTGYNIDPNGLFELQGNSQPLAVQSPPNTPPYMPTAQLVVGTPFLPA